MSVIDCERLLSEVVSSTNGPCGPAPDGDPLFDELQSASRPKPESMIASVENGADRTNWRDIQNKAVDLFSRTKDLQTAVTLCQALLRLEGFAGFVDGLRTLHGLLDRYWDAVHPQLSDDDQRDPLIRINRVAALNDAPTMLRAVRDAELAAAPGAGRVTLRDVQIAKGQLVAPENDSAPKTTEQIDAVFTGADLARLGSNAEAIADSLQLVGQIEALFATRSNNAHRLDVDALKVLLGDAQTLLRGWIERRSAVAAGSADGPFAGGATDPTAAGAGRPIGAISSRQDAVRALDAIGTYFDQHEPSSPVSLLVQRARRLVSKSFIEIMRDVAPGGLPEAQKILGVKDEQSS